MTKDEEVNRWRRWVENNKPAERFHRLDEYFNSIESDTNWGITNAQREWLEGKFNEGHKEEPAPEEDVVRIKTALPIVYSEDRERRNAIWDYKRDRRDEYIRKGFHGKELNAKMEGLRVPRELRGAPIIAPLEKDGQRIDTSSGIVLLKKRNVKIPYATRVFTNDRIIYKDASGKTLTWYGGYALVKSQNVMMPYATKTIGRKRITYRDFNDKMITWRTRPRKSSKHH